MYMRAGGFKATLTLGLAVGGGTWLGFLVEPGAAGYISLHLNSGLRHAHFHCALHLHA